MSTEKAGDEKWGELAERLFKKTLAANRLYWENTLQSFSNITSGQKPLAEWQEQSSKLWSEAYGGMLRISFQYAENLLDFGIGLSNSIYGQAGQTEDEAAEDTTAASEPEPLVVRLAGKQGERLSSAFALNSKENHPQKGNFKAGGFYAVDDGKAASIKIAFEPPTFEIQPAEPLEVRMQISIPADVAPGRYHCPVNIEGLGDSRFELILDVAAKAAEVTEKPKSRSTPRKKKTNS